MYQAGTGLDQVDWDDYDFIDLGASSGGSLKACSTAFGAGRGLGVDLSPRKVAKSRAAGLDVVHGDALRLAETDVVRFVSAVDFLEHLPNLDAVESAIDSAAQAATDFIYIGHPSFEGEHYLASLGLIQYWHKWSGHTSHIRVSDYCQIFDRLGLHRYAIQYVKPIENSNHPSILPGNLPPDQGPYDPDIHGKRPSVHFSESIWRAQRIYIALRDFSAEEWQGVVTAWGSQSLATRHDNGKPDQEGSAVLKPLVYDVGMNKGQNIPYYLSKGCRVVAIEAAPPLAKDVRERFATEIDKGDLAVLNVGVSSGEGSLPFYFNTVSTFRSSFRRPGNLTPEWTVVDVPTMRLSQILHDYGVPYFVKIDIEHRDRLALLDLLQAGIVPPGISVEVHSIDVLCTLIAMGYTEFQLVNGSDVGRSVSQRRIRRMDGSKADHDFPRHSAGPFGDDLDGRWVPAPHVLDRWLTWRRSERRGWLDAHAQAPSR